MSYAGAALEAVRTRELAAQLSTTVKRLERENAELRAALAHLQRERDGEILGALRAVRNIQEAIRTEVHAALRDRA